MLETQCKRPYDEAIFPGWQKNQRYYVEQEGVQTLTTMDPANKTFRMLIRWDEDFDTLSRVSLVDIFLKYFRI